MLYLKLLFLLFDCHLLDIVFITTIAFNDYYHCYGKNLRSTQIESIFMDQPTKIHFLQIKRTQVLIVCTQLLLFFHFCQRFNYQRNDLDRFFFFVLFNSMEKKKQNS